MKVNLIVGVDFDDETRRTIAKHVDGADGKGKRLATRDECRDYMWQRGARWEDYLSGEAAPEASESDAEDLMGTGPIAAPEALEAPDDDPLDLL